MKDAQLAPSEPSLIKECRWKDGGKGGRAPYKTTRRKLQNLLDSDRPSHGRTYTTNRAKIQLTDLHGIQIELNFEIDEDRQTTPNRKACLIRGK
jgi:hypothetical protein